MYIDVTDLSNFYASPMGVVVRRTLRKRIRERWPNIKNETIIGLGYAPPYLSSFQGEARRIGALMPAKQGVITWPRKGPYLSCLVENWQLPLTDASIDRVLAIHSLEMSEASPRFLREIWRVLKPEGRVLFIVPNRRSLWSRLDSTPFGHGRPYSQGQMERLLSGAMFQPTEMTTALHTPPFKLPAILRAATAWERIGTKLTSGLGGVVMIEAVKQVAAPISGHPVKILVHAPVTAPISPLRPKEFRIAKHQHR